VDTRLGSDISGNAEFVHRTVDVGATSIHYVTSGSGPAVILLHGWPQTWHAWRRVAAFLPDHSVVMPDLRGFGQSAKPASGYDAATMAADLHALVSALGRGPVTVVGHDWGAVFGYVLAASHPADVCALGIVEMALPGAGVLEQAMQPRAGGQFLWHFGFQSVPDIPELLLAGNERAYLTWFFDHHAHDPGAVAAADRDVYIAAMEEPEALRAGLADSRGRLRRRCLTGRAGPRLGAHGGAWSAGRRHPSMRSLGAGREPRVRGRCGPTLDESRFRVKDPVPWQA
jgi:pimeloyl-ACP methyl ester carboxylesterase